MKCFQLVKSVLDEIYAEIPEIEEVKDVHIRLKLNYLRNSYKGLLRNPVPIDYTSPVVRFAYVYTYVTAHANFVFDRISNSAALRSLFHRDQFTVSCIGGGPGSDLLGMLKYLEAQNRSPKLKCYIFDREEKWGESWSDIEQKVNGNLRLSVFFQRFDVTDLNSPSSNKKFISQSDLFTLTYFLSEIHHFQDLAAPFFSGLMQNAHPGSLFLYLDNNYPAFFGWFDALSAANGLKTVEIDNTNLMVTWDEDKQDLQPYLNKFGANPKLTGNIAYRLCQKE